MNVQNIISTLVVGTSLLPGNIKPTDVFGEVSTALNQIVNPKPATLALGVVTEKPIVEEKTVIEMTHKKDIPKEIEHEIEEKVEEKKWAKKSLSKTEKLFAHTERMATIKEELITKAEEFEKKMEQKRIQKNKNLNPTIAPAIKQQPLPQTFKYGQSMVHLTLILKGFVILTPRPENKDLIKTWFWNNGDYLEKEKTEYQVLYNGKKYRSTYDTQEKTWKGDENASMDLLTYYMYLIENNGNIEPFVHYIVRMAIKKDPVMFVLDQNKDNTEKIAYLTNLFTNIILEEEKNKNKYVFYSGYPGNFDLVYDFITILSNYLYIQNEHLERSFNENIPLYKSAKELFYKHKTTHDWTLNTYLMSTNIALFGNFGNIGECSVYYFCSARSMSNEIAEKSANDSTSIKILKNLCSQIGLTWYKNIRFFDYDYAKLGGKLKQIFIPPQYTDQISYLSEGFGELYNIKHTNELIKCLVQYFTKKSDINNDDYELLTTNNVLSLMRSDPINSCFFYTKNISMVYRPVYCIFIHYSLIPIYQNRQAYKLFIILQTIQKSLRNIS